LVGITAELGFKPLSNLHVYIKSKTNQMQKAILMTVLTMLTVLVGTAQIRRVAKPRPATDSLVTPAMAAEVPNKKEALRQLELTKEQKKRIKEAATTVKAERQAIEADTSLTIEQKKKAIRQLARQRRAGMDSLLTPEQRQKAQQMRKEAIQQRKAGKQQAAEAGEANKKEQ
jgi:Spy/CpxP family protein refolding chaperone